MTFEELREVVEQIQFEDWSLHIGVEAEAFTLQWVFWAEDVESEELQEQRARKWRLSKHSTPSEVVQTALLAVFVAMEHEVRETFLYRGAKVFGPHIDVESRVGIASALETR